MNARDQQARHKLTPAQLALAKALARLLVDEEDRGRLPRRRQEPAAR